MSERESFEAWFSEDGKYPHAVKRSGEGYLFAAANSQWEAWQASREALKAEQKAGDGFMCVPVADLYELLHKGGEAYSYTSSASDAVYWVKEGYTVREYVKLERLQEAFDQPVTDSWIACADRVPEDDDFVYIWPRPDFGVELHVGQYCKFHKKGAGWYAQVNEQNYGIEWHPVTVTHWMPLPSPPAMSHPIDTTSQQYEALSKGESK